jgi:hypothetical protein
MLCGPPYVPESHAQRDPESSIRPHEEEHGEAIHRSALLAAVAKGFGITVSSMIRTPRSQTNSVRQVTSRRVCPDQSPCSILVKQACATVLSASASATPLPDVRS